MIKNADTKIPSTDKSNTIDPFDLASIRLGQDFAANLGARKELVVAPVRKPPPQEFIRVMPDESMRIITALLEWHEDRELYLVAPRVAEIIGKEAKPYRLIPAMTATQNFFIWPMKITLEGQRENTWNMSAEAAAVKAVTKWVNISSNPSAQAYDVRVAEGKIPEPEWPKLTLQEILKLAFKDRFIQDLDHPIVKKLKGVF